MTHLASADSHEQAALTLPDGAVVLLHDCVKSLTSALGLCHHLLQGCQFPPNAIGLQVRRYEDRQLCMSIHLMQRGGDCQQQG